VPALARFRADASGLVGDRRRELLNRHQYLAARPERQADPNEIGFGQVTRRVQIDFVRLKRRGIFLERDAS
jgi:hypothetical protein